MHLRLHLRDYDGLRLHLRDYDGLRWQVCEAPGTPEWKRDEGEGGEQAGPKHVAKEGDLFGEDNLEYADTPLKSP
eukprot:9121948-Pyramimonas_sp.AAC.1